MRLNEVLGEQHFHSLILLLWLRKSNTMPAQQSNLSIRESFVSCDVSNDLLEHFDKLFLSVRSGCDPTV